ncbi:hypothetical protein VKT23_008204 [Stygiomarasmius scandens]|uniref:Uncharacterized protein n=1 Tax=Marasmiellus scandens TaxID=2682957 RepID=A0ABR1JKC6_9AGAR
MSYMGLGHTLPITLNRFGFPVLCPAGVPKCMNRPNELDTGDNWPQTQHKTDFIIHTFDPGIVWDEFGSRSDVAPFTFHFPHANIHELLSPDLLHQAIKGTFKDHMVEWVMDYVIDTYSSSRVLEILKDIDQRISAVLAFPGLQRFPDGQNFNQWTGDDSKALMKVYLAAIAGYVPGEMLKAMSAFLQFCYIAHQNSHSVDDLESMNDALDHFHHHRNIFIELGIWEILDLTGVKGT